MDGLTKKGPEAYHVDVPLWAGRPETTRNGKGKEMIRLEEVFRAQTVLRPIIRKTAVVRAYGIAPHCELYLKPENLQITGSFKVRGAGYKMAMLTEEEKKRGVVACSAGNHAQGVALAASKSGIRSVICLPDSAPISKVEATRGFGAEVVLVPGVYDDAYRKALELKDSEGFTFVHPFDDESVIAGQGTIGLEILNEMEAEEEYKRNFPASFTEGLKQLMKKAEVSQETLAEKIGIPFRTFQLWIGKPDKQFTVDFVIKVSLALELPEWISDLLLDRAGLSLSRVKKRDLALIWIQRVMWKDGIEVVNQYLKEHGFDPLAI